MPSQAEIEAVFNNGAGLAQDTLLRRFMFCRHNTPNDGLSVAMETTPFMSLFFDEQKLLKPELDFFVEWTDFLDWIEAQRPVADFEPGVDVEEVIKAIETAQNFDPVTLPDGVIHHYNFITKKKLRDAPIILGGISIVVEGDKMQMFMSGICRDENVFIYTDGHNTNVSRQIAEYLNEEALQMYCNGSFRWAPYLTNYIDAAELELVKQRTKYSAVKEQLKKTKGQTASRPQDRIQFRVIRRVKRIRINPSKTVSVKESRTEPQYKVNVHGFWRKIDGVGKDPQGLPVIGKTWVRNHTRWNDKPEKKTVWIKEPMKAEKKA